MSLLFYIIKERALKKIGLWFEKKWLGHLYFLHYISFTKVLLQITGININVILCKLSCELTGIDYFRQFISGKQQQTRHSYKPWLHSWTSTMYGFDTLQGHSTGFLYMHLFVCLRNVCVMPVLCPRVFMQVLCRITRKLDSYLSLIRYAWVKKHKKNRSTK